MENAEGIEPTSQRFADVGQDLLVTFKETLQGIEPCAGVLPKAVFSSENVVPPRKNTSAPASHPLPGLESNQH